MRSRLFRLLTLVLVFACLFGAVAYAADRTAYLEGNEPGKGICFQYG